MKLLRSLFLFLLFVAASAQALAQPPNDDCTTASTLCAQQPQTGDNTGAVGWPGFCPGTSNVLWYSFTTNSAGGPVNVDISAINCPGVAGMDNELSVIVLSGDGSCTPGSFNAESACEEDSVDFTLTTAALLPNTLYWVIVAGAQDNGATIAAQCGFDVTVGGPGANIVDVDFDAGMNATIGEGESIQLNATGGTNWDWTPTSGLSGNNIPDSIAQPTETTAYTVATQLNGCTYEDVVVIEVVRLISPPNTITPNGDGINDLWEIPGINDYPSCQVHVFDRWGQRVFRTTGYDEPWDGTNNGKALPTATYYYVIELNQLQGKSPPYTGYIAIVR